LRFSLLGQAAARKKQLLVGTRLRPEWRQGIRKDRAANPVFSDITFKWGGETPSGSGGAAATSLGEGGTIPPALRATSLYTREAWGPPSPSALLPPPSGREAQSLRRGFAAPPPFTQGRHGSRPLRQLCCHLPRGGRHNPSVSLAADSSLCTREPLRRGGGASRIIFQAGGGCGVLRTSDRPAEGFLRRISH